MNKEQKSKEGERKQKRQVLGVKSRGGGNQEENENKGKKEKILEYLRGIINF